MFKRLLMIRGGLTPEERCGLVRSFDVVRGSLLLRLIEPLLCCMLVLAGGDFRFIDYLKVLSVIIID